MTYGPRRDKKFQILCEASLDMIRSNKQKTKALIRLRGCAGWSTPLLFANMEDRFSRAEAQLLIYEQ